MKKVVEKIFVLTSVTYAMKAKDLLEKQHIPSSLTREAAIRQIRSCGYGVKVPESDALRAEELLAEYGIRILGIAESKNGKGV